MNWRKHTIAILAARPTEWVRLCELFSQVEPEIPIHIAMRHAARVSPNTEVGINTARWRLFMYQMGPLVERRSSNLGEPAYRAVRTDVIRLLPHEVPCSECGGPRFLTAWPDRGFRRQFTCRVCEAPPAAPIAQLPNPAAVEPAHYQPAAEIIEVPKPARKLNAHQRRGNRPSRRINPVGFTQPKRRWIEPVKPKARASSPRPPPGIPNSRSPVTIHDGRFALTFENRRALASHLRWFLDLKSINQADAELQHHDIAQVLAKRGKQVWEFIKRVRDRMWWRSSIERT